MRGAAVDEPLARRFVALQCDGCGAIAGGTVFPGAFVTQGIDEPRLTFGIGPQLGPDRRVNLLAGFGLMLLPQRDGFGPAEVAQAQRLGLDVEGAAAGDDFVVGGVNPIVPHIAHAAQDDGLRKRAGPLGVAGADLAQQRNEGVADEGVHFVEKQHDGARIAAGPEFQHAAQPVGGPALPMTWRACSAAALFFQYTVAALASARTMAAMPSATLPRAACAASMLTYSAR